MKILLSPFPFNLSLACTGPTLLMSLEPITALSMCYSAASLWTSFLFSQPNSLYAGPSASIPIPLCLQDAKSSFHKVDLIELLLALFTLFNGSLYPKRGSAVLAFSSSGPHPHTPLQQALSFTLTWCHPHVSPAVT